MLPEDAKQQQGAARVDGSLFSSWFSYFGILTLMLKYAPFNLQFCSMEVDTEGLAVMGATLANGGICPTTGEKVLSATSVRDTLSLMYSCGMYNYSGNFAFRVCYIINQV